MNGFGDFLIVGDEFSESGGPAYAVAIHLTYINTKHEDEMYIYHLFRQHVIHRQTQQVSSHSPLIN